jgi:hypothetical protein
MNKIRINPPYLINIGLIIISMLASIIGIELTGRFLGLGTPLLYESDHIVGYRPRPSQAIKRGKGARTTIDKEGFRVAISSQNNHIDVPILFIGDSVTFGGTSIDDGNIFSSILCENKKEQNCINGAVNGWGTANMGRLISNINLYTKRRIKKVVLVILPGDEERNLSQLKGSPFWSNYPVGNSSIIELIGVSTKLYIQPLIESKDSISQNSVSEIEERRLKSKKDNWQELRAALSKSQIPITLVITPPLDWFQNNYKIWPERNAINQELKITRKLKSIERVCNLIDFLPKTNKFNSWYVDNSHLSTLGHIVWAHAIEKCLALS